MQGAGNDYIYFDCMDGEPDDPGALSLQLSDRHHSIGGDGVILLCRSDVADCKMKMFNADGSEGKMCGNGVRCVGKLAHDLGYVKGDVCTVETLSGIKTLSLRFDRDGKVVSARVDMGRAMLSPRDIPARIEKDRVIDHPISVGGKDYRVTLVSMGNPHCITYVENPYKMNIEALGPLFENHELFPDRINTEFVRVDARNEVTVRVWERGSGETWACGTGACAVAVSTVLNGFADMGVPVTVHLRGGDLIITYTEDAVYMEGDAKLVYIGEVEI